MRARVLRQRGRVHVLTARPGFAGWPGRVAMRGRHVADLLHDLQRAVRGRVGAQARRLDQLQRAAGAARSAAAARRHHARGSPPPTAGSTQRWCGAGMSRARASARWPRRLGSLSPLAVLGRGYAVCWDDGPARPILRDAAAVRDGDRDSCHAATRRAARRDGRPERLTAGGDRRRPCMRRTSMDPHDQGLRRRHRRARGDRQEARGGRPAARGVARPVRARRGSCPASATAARRRRAPHRDPQRARRAETGARVLRRRRRRRLARTTAR